MQKITPCLWFDTHAEEAMNRLVATFSNSKVTTISRYPDAELDDIPMKNMAGKVLTEIFELDGYQFMALDGGPAFKFSPAVSFFVNCAALEEADRVWATLSECGNVMMPFQKYPFSEKFGWTADKYGISWQIVPKILGELMSNPDPVKSRRVTEAMLKMKKIDIEGLKQAAMGD